MPCLSTHCNVNGNILCAPRYDEYYRIRNADYHDGDCGDCEEDDAYRGESGVPIRTIPANENFSAPARSFCRNAASSLTLRTAASTRRPILALPYGKNPRACTENVFVRRYINRKYP